MPLPIAHGLIGASIVAATLPDASPLRNWKPLLLGAAVASGPDLDYFLPTSSHRGITHSLIFAAMMSLICFGIWRKSNVRLAIGLSGAAFSHSLLDYVTTKTMPGVELLWPLSNRRFGLGLVDYYQLTGIDPIFFLYQDVLRDLLKMALMELLIAVPIFLFVLALKWSVNKFSRS
jgi:membrane-bound metal-dependent hydrolase YbcI (DUF457 family)